MSIIECLTNDNFRVLSHLYDIRDRDNSARITQQELAEAMDLSRATINKILKCLKNEKYIIQSASHTGRYVITGHAMVVVSEFRKIERKL